MEEQVTVKIFSRKEEDGSRTYNMKLIRERSMCFFQFKDLKELKIVTLGILPKLMSCSPFEDFLNEGSQESFNASGIH